MWKPLTSTQRVNSGDKIRYIHPDIKKAESLFKVVKPDEHYFEILPVDEDDPLQNDFTKKIVRYFDIGYNIQIEVRNECI